MADDAFSSDARQQEVLFQAMAAEIRVAMPGVIQAFDAGTQRAVVMPCCTQQVNIDGAVSYVDLPPILNVPVVVPFAQAAGLLITLPLRAGDEGLLVFADRAIDNIVQMGGVQPPVVVGGETARPRAHALTDAIFIPGLITAPQAVPGWSTDAIVIRDREGTTSLSLSPGKIEATDGAATATLEGGVVTINAPNGFFVTAPNIQIGNDGATLPGDVEAGGISLKGHVHSGIMPGGGTTGGPQ